MTCGSALASARPTDRKQQQQPERDSTSQAANSVDEEDREGGEVYEGYAEGNRRSNRRRSSRRSGAYSNTGRQLLAAESDNAAEPAAKRSVMSALWELLGFSAPHACLLLLRAVVSALH
jgi:hypothetical protein